MREICTKDAYHKPINQIKILLCKSGKKPSPKCLLWRRRPPFICFCFPATAAKPEEVSKRTADTSLFPVSLNSVRRHQETEAAIRDRVWKDSSNPSKVVGYGTRLTETVYDEPAKYNAGPANMAHERYHRNYLSTSCWEGASLGLKRTSSSASVSFFSTCTQNDSPCLMCTFVQKAQFI